jgi:hypothetical protein
MLLATATFNSQLNMNNRNSPIHKKSNVRAKNLRHGVGASLLASVDISDAGVGLI